MIKFLVYSNIFISLAAGSLSLGTFHYFNIPGDYSAYIILVFAATLFDYNLHQIIKFKLKIGAKEKNDWAKSHYIAILVMTILALTVSIISFFYIPIKFYKYLAIAVLLTILYSIPFKYLRIDSLDIRKVPFMKNVIIAIAWTIITFIIPFQYSGETFSFEIIIGLIQRFFFILALTIPFDISDIQEDKIQNFKTIPVLLGSKNSWILANSLFIAIIAIAFINFPSNYSIATLLTCVSAIIILNNKRLRKRIYYNAIWIDGIILLNGILLITNIGV